MDFKELCLARYSCREYKKEPVPQEKLDYIRECVRLAPSAVNLQPWRFLVIDDQALGLHQHSLYQYIFAWSSSVLILQKYSV